MCFAPTALFPLKRLCFAANGIVLPAASTDQKIKDFFLLPAGGRGKVKTQRQRQIQNIMPSGKIKTFC
jgi:hypothetical protein